jgi:hypothetical protein
VRSAAGDREDEQRGENERPKTHPYEAGTKRACRQVAVSA